MKKVNLIINVVLVVAIGVLYFLHFKSQPEAIETKKENTALQSSYSGDEMPIAYIQIDTLLSKMNMYTDLTDKLTKKQQKLESTFTSQYQSFEREITDYQTKVSKGLLTRSEAQSLEAGLGQKQQQLEQQRNSYLSELQEEGIVSQNKVINYIMEYLKEYNADNKYKYIFSYTFGGGLLFVDDASNITPEVLEGINAKYQKEK